MKQTSDFSSQCLSLIKGKYGIVQCVGDKAKLVATNYRMKETTVFCSNRSS